MQTVNVVRINTTPPMQSVNNPHDNDGTTLTGGGADGITSGSINGIGSNDGPLSNEPFAHVTFVSKPSGTRSSTQESQLDEATRYVLLSQPVAELRAVAARGAPVLSRARVVLISSTQQGGGVAEMLHQIVPLCGELGLNISWAIIVPRSDIANQFWNLTGRLHRALHGGNDTPVFSDSDALLFRNVGKDAAINLLQILGPTPDGIEDCYIVHDPQPAGMLSLLKTKGLCTWRCHIGSACGGLSPSAAAAWGFLNPYLVHASGAVFSVRSYIPLSLKDRSFIVAPGISPLSSKNKELPLSDIVSTLIRSGSIEAPLDSARARCGAVDPDYSAQTSFYGGKASGWVLGARGRDDDVVCEGGPSPVVSVSGGGEVTTTATGEVSASDSAATGIVSDSAPSPTVLSPASSQYPLCSIGRCVTHALKEGRSSLLTGNTFAAPLLFRPCIVQVSRFDSLKGFEALLRGFALLKTERQVWALRRQGGDDTRATMARRKRLLCNATLLLCGPDPSGVADDTSASLCLEALCAVYDSLPTEVQEDVFIARLPMTNAEENSLIVNAIQRSAMVIVQNSKQEGFGLTVAEARYKRQPVIGTMAEGIKEQCTNGVDAILVEVRPGHLCV
jgi:glycosyltransferase involved in cell wall biosynthesis